MTLKEKKMTDKEKIRAEIESRIEMYRNTEHRIDPNRIDEDECLLAFIDSLSEEPDKSLDEAAEEYTEGYDTFAEWTEHYGAFETVNDIPLIKKAFIAGAEWAMHYQEKKIADAYEKGKQEGIRVVRSWESSPGQCGY